MLVVPTLMQISTGQLVKALTKKESRGWDLQLLPPNLKDNIRSQWLHQVVYKKVDCDISKMLNSLVHEKVRELDLSDCSPLVYCLDFLLKCPMLTKLNLKNALKEVKLENYDTIFRRLPYLQVLYLHFNPELEDGIIYAFTKHNSRLREVDLEHCTSISEHGFAQLRQLKALQCVNFAFTNITDFAIGEIFAPNGAKNVKELRLDHCKQITDDAIDIILEEQGDQLDIFIMHACPLLTLKSITAFENFHNVKQVSWTIY